MTKVSRSKNCSDQKFRSGRVLERITRAGSDDFMTDRVHLATLMTDIVEVARYHNRIEADLVRLYLGSEGVEAILFDTEINYFYGGLFLPVRLMVLDEDLETARKLLEAKT